MQWLNNVDDALDRVFLRPSQRRSEVIGGDGASSRSGANVSFTSSSGGVSIDDDGGTAAADGAVVPSNSGRLLREDHHGGSDGLLADDHGEKLDVSANNSSSGGSSQPNAIANTSNFISKPPPPPPPNEGSTASTSSTQMQSTTCPLTPIAAAAGEYLVVTESPVAFATSASITTNTNTPQHVPTNNEQKECGDATHCQPLDSLLASDGIAAAACSAHDVSSSERVSLISSQQLMQLTQQQQLRMEDLASSVNDNCQYHGRYDERSDDRAVHNTNDGGRVRDSSKVGDNRGKRIPPPPQLRIHQTQQPLHHQHKYSSESEPSSSNFIVHLPTYSSPDPTPSRQIHPLSTSHTKSAIPPLPYSSTNDDREPTTPLPTQTTYHSSGTTSRTTTPRSTHRPTPGVIRRRIRAPSISPPSSPLPSFDGGVLKNDDGDDDEDAAAESGDKLETHRRNATIPPPPPPFVTAATTTTMDRIGSSGGMNDAKEYNEIVQRINTESNEGSLRNSLQGWLGMKDTADEAKIEEDVDDDFTSTSFNSQASNRSELTDDNEADGSVTTDIEDFAIPSTNSVTFHNDHPWDPSFNCYGVVHVRLLRAQRLPCGNGISVYATLSLPPWKGKIRVPGRIAVDLSEAAGVCIRWDKPWSRNGGDGLNRQGNVKDEASPLEADGGEDSCFHSMVHAYNNEETPVPSILLELSVSTLGGVFERVLCSVSIPCDNLMKDPSTWSRRWHTATIDKETTSEDPSLQQQDATNPLVLIEACFEPKVDEPEPILSEDSDTLGSIPRDFAFRASPDRRLRSMPDVISSIEDDSISKTSTLTSAVVSRQHTKSHLLRVRSFWTPAWCAVCSKILTGGWAQCGFECEACHIFCCRDCQLQVDIRLPCGSELAKIAVTKAQRYQIGQIMTTLAPQKEPVDEGQDKQQSKRTGVRDSDAVNDAKTLRKIEGIGTLSVRVLNACLFDKTFPPDAEPTEIFQLDSSNLRHGDHYVRISWLGSKDSKRTKTVLQASKPVFDSDEMVFDVPHYGMEYKLEVVDANTDKPVGSCLLSAQGLLQLQRDELTKRWDQLLLSLLHLRQDSETRRIKLELRTGVKDGFGLNYYNSTKFTDDTKGKRTASVAGEISGWIEMDVRLEEDAQLFYSSEPRQCPPRAAEEFDIATIQLHIARITAIFDDIQRLIAAYFHLVSWDNYTLTGISMVRSQQTVCCTLFQCHSLIITSYCINYTGFICCSDTDVQLGVPWSSSGWIARCLHASPWQTTIDWSFQR